MKFDPFKHHRCSIRLKGYDYTQAGLYFVTISAQGDQCMFGELVDGEMRLNPAGEMVCREWYALADRFPTIELDTFVVMPNHVHGIIFIQEEPIVGAGLVPARDPEIGGPRAPTRGAPTGGDSNTAEPEEPIVGAGLVPAQSPALGDIVGAFKSITTRRYINGVKAAEWPAFYKRLWQRNYYEHIIRNERALAAIRAYVDNNPAGWREDRLHPDNPLRKKFLE